MSLWHDGFASLARPLMDSKSGSVERRESYNLLDDALSMGLSGRAFGIVPRVSAVAE